MLSISPHAARESHSPQFPRCTQETMSHHGSPTSPSSSSSSSDTSPQRPNQPLRVQEPDNASSASSHDSSDLAENVQQHLLNYLRAALQGNATIEDLLRVRSTLHRENGSDLMTDSDQDDSDSDFQPYFLQDEDAIEDSSEEDDFPTASDRRRQFRIRRIKEEFLRNMSQKLALLRESDFYYAVQGAASYHSENGAPLYNIGDLNSQNVFHMLRYRQRYNDIAQNYCDRMAPDLTAHCVPNYEDSLIQSVNESLFCGQFSHDGNIFVSACQDQIIRLYDVMEVEDSIRQLNELRADSSREDTTPRTRSRTSTRNFEEESERLMPRPFKNILARDVGWSIIDVDFSPDQNSLIYSSWSPYVHLIDVNKEDSKHESLYLSPPGRFCGFSIRFSPNSQEFLVGGSDGNIYIYDLGQNRRTSCVQAHNADINSVAYAHEDDGNIFYSGSDDSLCKVWDKRMFSEQADVPVGVLCGHSAGITCLDSKGDARYFISNGKDSSLKLFDIRRMSDPGERPPPASNLTNHYDYRYQQIPSNYTFTSNPNDQSLSTYTGHRVLRTLIRCYFSPKHSTNQRYAYTGSFDGTVFIYDLLTGKTVQKLVSHTEVVRDCAWHPNYPFLYSSGWDGVTLRWAYFPEME